jgi:malate permease and related proteins
MVIPFAELFFPKNGLGLLFIHNIGFIFVIWTLGVFIFQGGYNFKSSLKGLINPGLISTIAAVIIVIFGFNKFIPAVVNDVFKTIGSPTLPVSMIVAGAQIYKLGKNALKFDLFNILIGVNRLILIPGILFLLSLFLKNYFSKEIIGIFMIVNVMPVSIISVSMAIRYGSDPELASQNIVSNHILSMITIPVFIILIKFFLM